MSGVEPFFWDTLVSSKCARKQEEKAYKHSTEAEGLAIYYLQQG